MAGATIRLPRYDARAGRWTGGDPRRLYAFVDKITGRVLVRPGDRFYMKGMGPAANVRPATRAEAEQRWQNPIHAGWKTLGAPPRIPPEAYRLAPGKKFEYCVHEGRPSWHQQRAGHTSAGAMCFYTKRKAEAFLRRVRKLRPDEPAFLVTRPRPFVKRAY